MCDCDAKEGRPGSMTRRQFIKSVIAAGVVSFFGPFFPGPAGAMPKATPGSVERLITLTVNGQQRRVDVMPQETLARTLRDKLRLNTTVTGATFDERNSMWRLTIDGGAEITGRHVVMAVGGLERPKLPDIPGLQDFGGARIVALVERSDRLEIAPQPQLHRIAGRDRIDIGEQARGFGKFAEVRFLKRAVEGEFARINVAGGGIVRGAAR